MTTFLNDAWKNFIKLTSGWKKKNWNARFDTDSSELQRFVIRP